MNKNCPMLGLIGAFLLAVVSLAHGQTRGTPVRTAYSALSAGIGTLWLTQEEGHFRKHGLTRI
jgi:hypothetical protein